MGSINSCLKVPVSDGKVEIVSTEKDMMKKDRLLNESHEESSNIIYEICPDEGLLRAFLTGDMEIVILQSLLRGFIDRKKIKERRTFNKTRGKLKKTISNTRKSADHSNLYSSRTELNVKDLPNYSTPTVTEVLCRLGPYTYQKKLTLKGIIKRNPVLLENGAIYTGHWNSLNQRHGRGVQLWTDGSIYEGYWEADMACGKGRLISSNGNVYEGDWKNDEASGFGIHESANGTKYEGYWENNCKNGEGVETSKDGKMYKGMFSDGLQHGFGKIMWDDGKSYEGEFRNNNIEGNGTYHWRDGRIYVGEWLKNKMHGKGRFTWPNGRIYEGEFHHDKKQGYGVFVWPDQRKYEGEWHNGKQHGNGTYTTKAGTKHGSWEKGKRITLVQK